MCAFAIPRQMPRSLSEMLSQIRNDPSEASEKCGGGGLHQVRDGKEQQWDYLLPSSCLNLFEPDSL